MAKIEEENRGDEQEETSSLKRHRFNAIEMLKKVEQDGREDREDRP